MSDLGCARHEGGAVQKDMTANFSPDFENALNAASKDAPVSNPSAPSENAATGQIESRPSDEETIKRLSALSPLEYDRVRLAEAEALGVRSPTLDKLVAEARGEREEDRSIVFEEVEPWPDAVDGATVFLEIVGTIRRFIVCDSETANATALWCALTWFIDVVDVAPLAVITAPEKRCGKTILLSIIGRLSRRPLIASNISPAALFRSIDAWGPTLLIDEADAFARDNEELRGILNCGHTRDTAYTIRTVGDDFEPTRFSVWGAKALAGIGHLADTLMDRSITLALRRKLPHESADRLRHADPDLFPTLAAKLARFAEDSREAVRRARPDLPKSLNDRAQDNWEPLLAIAEVVGGPWPDFALIAALKLAGAESPLQSTGTELLADIKEIFETKWLNRISTADLIEALCADDEKLWATYNRGKPITPRQVAKHLGGYGINSRTIRTPKGTPKGYNLDQFEEAFSCYLTSPQSTNATPSQFNNDAEKPVADTPPHC